MLTDKQIQDILDEESAKNPPGPYAMTHSAAALREAMQRAYEAGRKISVRRVQRPPFRIGIED